MLRPTAQQSRTNSISSCLFHCLLKQVLFRHTGRVEEQVLATGGWFTVLGPVRAWRAGSELDLGSPQQRAVLAALLLRHGAPVSVEDLIDAL